MFCVLVSARAYPFPQGPIIRGIEEGLERAVADTVDRVIEGPYYNGGYNQGGYNQGGYAKGYNQGISYNYDPGFSNSGNFGEYYWKCRELKINANISVMGNSFKPKMY